MCSAAGGERELHCPLAATAETTDITWVYVWSARNLKKKLLFFLPDSWGIQFYRLLPERKKMSECDK